MAYDAPTKTNTQTKTITFRIQRQDALNTAPYWQVFEIDHRPNMNVISALQAIASKAKTVEGKTVSPVVWDCNCLEEVCGACTMLINGKVRQSCSALIDTLLKDTHQGPITLEPMSKFPVIRDLYVDRSRMFDALTKIKAWVPIDGTHALEAGPRESQDTQQTRYDLSKCMTCGCCVEACPQYTIDNDFIGAAAISQARYFNAHETGANLKDDRLTTLEAPGGITDCGNAQNCVKVCPKDIPLTESIATMGRQTTLHVIKNFFVGK